MLPVTIGRRCRGQSRLKPNGLAEVTNWSWTRINTVYPPLSEWFNQAGKAQGGLQFLVYLLILGGQRKGAGQMPSKVKLLWIDDAGRTLKNVTFENGDCKVGLISALNSIWEVSVYSCRSSFDTSVYSLHESVESIRTIYWRRKILCQMLKYRRSSKNLNWENSPWSWKRNPN